MAALINHNTINRIRYFKQKKFKNQNKIIINKIDNS
jgi:hypothetical protein